MAKNTLHLVLVSSLFCSVGALGTTDVDTADTVGFVEEDNQRDTISLLISCFATLGLCVYSAVHLNVPRKAERKYRTPLRELQWCVIGLFAPELILYAAWRQLASARQLRYEVEQARKEENIRVIPNEKAILVTQGPAQDDVKRTPWTIAHGFYGSMGGFVIDLDDADNRYACLFGSQKRLILTANGVALLAHCGHIPNITLDDIKDKNKADGLAKLLVCVQAGWMIVQVISRAASGLPSTLLEVHVVAHVVCALIMYVLWWHKPRQVESPTTLKGEELWPLVVYMYLASQISGKLPMGTFAKSRVATPELVMLAYFEDGETVDETHPGRNGRFGLRPATEHSSQEREPSSPIPDNEIKSEQIRLAAEAVMLYPALRSRFTRIPRGPARQDHAYSIPYTAELIQSHCHDWPNNGLLRRTQSLVMGMVLWGASMAYGAIHVAAWNYFFPSQLEQLFWHMSSIWVTFCAAFWLVTNLLAHIFPLIDRVWVAYNERRLNWMGTGVITLLCILCGVTYIASRGYIVVEAFISIRKVPKEVYQTPIWSQVFPHL